MSRDGYPSYVTWWISIICHVMFVLTIKTAVYDLTWMFWDKQTRLSLNLAMFCRAVDYIKIRQSSLIKIARPVLMLFFFWWACDMFLQDTGIPQKDETSMTTVRIFSLFSLNDILMFLITRFTPQKLRKLCKVKLCKLKFVYWIILGIWFKNTSYVNWNQYSTVKRFR